METEKKEEQCLDVQEEEAKPKMVKSIFGRYEKMLPEWMRCKTNVCQHHHGCFENIVKDNLKNFLVGFAIQTLLKNISLIANPGKLIRNL